MRNIKLLPESVRSCMRSGIILFDLTRVVEELVFNSLDAGAAKVIVSIGVGTNYIKVTDNGCGITRDGLVLLGERYATSKFEQLASMHTVPESFGFRGEALSSISDVSLLEVVTKPHGMPNGYRKIIKGCKCLYLGIDDDRQDVGTTVVVRDLFYNQPVKRRHLQSSPKKVLHSVKECILRIALVHLATCFKLIDIESGDDLLSLYPSSSPLPLLTTGFGIEISRSLHKLDESDGEFKLSGYISEPNESFSLKAFQYIYINSRYISKGPIHKLLNQLAAVNSSSDLLKSQSGKRNKCQTSPTYILNLTCASSYYDLSFEPNKTSVEFKDWDPVFAFIKKAVMSYWDQGAHVSEEDNIWNETDTLSTRDDLLSNYQPPKKRQMTRCHQDSVVLFSPQLKMPKEEPKLTKYSKDFGNEFDFDFLPDNLLKFSAGSSKDIHNKSVFKKPSSVCFQFNGDEENTDDEIMKPFLRSCSSHMDIRRTRDVDEFIFQTDGFKKWIYTNDNEEKDCVILGSEPWLDDTATVWSPPKKSSLLLNDPILTSRDYLTEDNSHRNDRFDLFGEKMHDEFLIDVPKRYSKHHRDEGFDLFPYEEKKTDVFYFDNMRYEKNVKNSQNDMHETEWIHSPVAAPHHMQSLSYTDGRKRKIDRCRLQNKQRKRSSSAPPFYKEKKKFIALNTCINVKSGKSCHKSPILQETSCQKHIQKPSGVNHFEMMSKFRHDKKKIIDKAEISDYEVEAACSLDVYNTDSDFISKENQDAIDFGVKWRNGCPLTSSKQKPNDVVNQESILDISSGILHISGDSLLPKSMSKKCMEDCRVLQQVDKKFIPVVGGGILAIIDQHAADERIRLEDLREKVLSGETKTVTYLDAEQELVLPEIGYQLLNNYSQQIQKWGWICNFHTQSSVSFKKNLNFLHNQPSVATLIAVPCILGVNLTDVDLLEFLQQLADTDGSSAIPPAVLRVLNFKACRGAIMFGDALLPSECSLIVEELKKTSMCFQCAHGRPTTAPLVNLVVLHKQIGKLGNWTHGSSGPWHGLSRHRPSLERAAQRLSQC